MTQKELLYIEDAVSHEQIISDMISQTLDFLEDEELVTFLKKEQKKHDTMKEKLMEFLKECSND